MMAVDANVWVAAQGPYARFHRDSVAFLSVVLGHRIPLVAPEIMPLEAACALARRAGRSEVGGVAFDRLQGVPGLRFLPIDASLLSAATVKDREGVSMNLIARLVPAAQQLAPADAACGGAAELGRYAAGLNPFTLGGNYVKQHPHLSLVP